MARLCVAERTEFFFKSYVIDQNTELSLSLISPESGLYFEQTRLSLSRTNFHCTRAREILQTSNARSLANAARYFSVCATNLADLPLMEKDNIVVPGRISVCRPRVVSLIKITSVHAESLDREEIRAYFSGRRTAQWISTL